ncbi:ABC transporter permease [Actinomyces qiguomingii]|uniref:ABC transporter permease n=1 Tax=Actinomyces qiguomingii TaxID=2057800 RepID=UPI000CA060B1|nr:ABC transporter permease [Actinomyces qiguomingii]
MNLVKAELLKLMTLPSVWVASALAFIVPVGLAWLSASTVHRALSTSDTSSLVSASTADAGFGQMTYGTIGIVVLGVVAMSSEYARTAQNVGASRQVTTTMVGGPKRMQTIASKLAVLAVWTVGLVIVTLPSSLAVSKVVLGDYATDPDGELLRKAVGVVLYWLSMALLSYAFTSVTRNGALSLIVLVANSSVVSFSLLISQLTDAARYLPDTAGVSMFLTDTPISSPLQPASAMFVTFGWLIASVLTASWCWVRRDA